MVFDQNFCYLNTIGRGTLTQVIREAMIEEIGNQFDFSDDDIEEMSARHYQGML